MICTIKCQTLKSTGTDSPYPLFLFRIMFILVFRTFCASNSRVVLYFELFDELSQLVFTITGLGFLFRLVLCFIECPYVFGIAF